jgi:hypothetical protein
MTAITTRRELAAEAAAPASASPASPAQAGSVQDYFGDTPNGHLVLHRTLLQSMPPQWQEHFISLVRGYDQAFAHLQIPNAAHWVARPAQERTVAELTLAEREELGVTSSVDDVALYVSDDRFLAACNDITYCDEDGRELQPTDRVLVPDLDDLIPFHHYGRTTVDAGTGTVPEESQ